MPKGILYYPTIEIPNEAWIKNTLLYWDEISSIVPYKGFYLPPNISLLQEHNCYTPIYPEDIFQKNTDKFLALLEKRLWDLPRRDPKVVDIYKNKMAWCHFHDIQEHYPEIKRLMESTLPNGNDRLLMGEKAVSLYMQTLAEFAVEDNNNYVIGTDKKSNISAFRYGYGNENIEENLLLDIILNRCVPIPNANVSIEEVLAFKSKHPNQLLDFQGEIERLQSRITQIQNPRELDDLIQQFKTDIETALTVGKTTLKDHAIKVAKASLKTGLAGLFSVGTITETLLKATGGLESVLLPLVSEAALATGTHIATTSVKNGIQYRTTKKSKFAYIMHAQKQGMYIKE